MTRPIDKFLERLEGVKPSGTTGRQWVACCPAHADREQSLSLGIGDRRGVLMSCHAGCKTDDILRAMNMTWKDMSDGGASEPLTGMSVSRLAVAKSLPMEKLSLDWKLRDKNNMVEIPYFDEQGNELFARTREGPTGHDVRQPSGTKLRPYGLWLLNQFVSDGQKQLILVEGESDCWSLWHHGFAALGIPGSGSTGTVSLANVSGFESVLIWKEPDSGGEKFAASMVSHLAAIGYTGKVLVYATNPDAKDPSAIAIRKQEKFREYFSEILKLAVPASPADRIPVHIPESVKCSGVMACPWPFGRYECTDAGNAGRFAHQHGTDVCYVEQWKKWYCWNGNIWEEADTAIDQYAMRTTSAIWYEAQLAPSDQSRIKLEQWWTRSQGLGHINAMKSLARQDMRRHYLDFGTRPELFVASNGTINLRTGELYPSRREDNQILYSPTPYNAVSRNEHWERFIQLIFPETNGHEGLQSFMKRLLGYACTAFTSGDNILPILWGPTGANGKSTLINILCDVLGPSYSGHAPRGMFMAKSNEQHPTQFADLHGKRAIFAMETGANKKLDVETVKYLTGGDKIVARRMGQDFWSFTPTHKCFIITNYEPKIPADDDAIWRRVLLIPFRSRFWKHGEVDQEGNPLPEGPAEYRQDDQALLRILSNKEGILRWLVEGAQEYLRDGLNPPECVRAATSQYRESEDVYASFFSEFCEFGPSYETTKSNLYARFNYWCKANNMHELSNIAFGKIMKRKGLGEKRDMHNRSWVGIRLITQPKDLDDLL